jgi:predicted metal-dependent phosphoesterase TrpH
LCELNTVYVIPEIPVYDKHVWVKVRRDGISLLAIRSRPHIVAAVAQSGFQDPEEIHAVVNDKNFSHAQLLRLHVRKRRKAR